MNVYVAGSRKQKLICRMVGQRLRSCGHTAYVFCDIVEEASQLSTIIWNDEKAKYLTAQSALRNDLIQRICALNKEQLEKADIVILVLPSGNSAHIEAGYAKGKKKHVYVFGMLVNGEWDAMYGLFDGVYGYDQLEELTDRITQHGS